MFLIFFDSTKVFLINRRFERIIPIAAAFIATGLVPSFQVFLRAKEDKPAQLAILY
jgi:hypothetical protein